MWPLISPDKAKCESGSAVIGFAIGAPFVLIAFIGFLNLTSLAWKGVGAEVKITNLIQQMIFNNRPAEGHVDKLHGDELVVYFSRGSEWGISRVVE